MFVDDATEMSASVELLERIDAPDDEAALKTVWADLLRDNDCSARRGRLNLAVGEGMSEGAGRGGARGS